MPIEEIRAYFKSNFFVERLTFSLENRKLIQMFEAPSRGYMLGRYLREKAWHDDLEGETKVYLIKDKVGFLVAFFSVKCGLLYDSHDYEKLEGEEFDFVDLVVEQYAIGDKKSSDTIQAYYDGYDRIRNERKDELLKIALRRYDDSEELRTAKDGRFAKRVRETYSAIEIAHFCKNVCYEYDVESMHGVALGAGLFWEKIIPRIREAISIVGCKYLYLFAADASADKGARSLIQYYKDDLRFDELQDLMIIKPDYDHECLAMIQDATEIVAAERAFWVRYQDTP